MKIWKKTKKNNFDDIILAWRMRSTGRFLSKIFSWLLGAFVIGLLTSIFFLAIQAPQLSQPMARLFFFIFFILGILSNYFRSFVNGLEYRITGDALVQVQPFSGFEKLNAVIGTDRYPFRTEYYFILWKDIKNIKDKAAKIQIMDKATESLVDIHMDRILKYYGYKNGEFFEMTGSDESQQTFDKKSRQLILKTARDMIN